MKKVHWMPLLGSIVAVELIGNIGSLATFRQITTWYASLNKPSFNPPNWLFGPVWTLLFALMGIAFYLVWQQKDKQPEQVKRATYVFVAQLVLNVLWSFLFFGAHNPFWGLIEIVVLWLFILWTILEFRKLSSTAAWCLIPYLVWVSFATLLTFAVWRLN